jgi:hypothetical protein
MVFDSNKSPDREEAARPGQYVVYADHAAAS